MTLHHQPICNWLVCKIINTKKRLSLCVCFHSSQLVRTLEFYSLLLSSQSILIVFWYLDDFPIGGWSPREETGWGTVNTDGWSHLPELSPGSVSPLSEPWSTVHQWKPPFSFVLSHKNLCNFFFDTAPEWQLHSIQLNGLSCRPGVTSPALYPGFLGV